MTENSENYEINFIDLTGDLVAAYVSNNSIPTAELPNLIQTIHAALTSLLGGAARPVSQDYPLEKPTAAQIRKSVTPHGIVSFIDGKTYKTLKRHLGGHGLSPDAYRHRYGLSPDYPMVSAEYAAKRSDLAKAIGLGRIQAAPQPVKEQPALPKPRGRKKAA